MENFSNDTEFIIYKCRICGKTYDTKVDLTKHFKYKHEEKKSHQCTSCHETFLSKDHLKQHMKSIHPEFGCKPCQKLFPTKQKLDRHYDSALHMKKNLEYTHPQNNSHEISDRKNNSYKV